MHNRLRNSLIATVLTLLLAQTSLALDSDSKQPATIEADQVQFDDSRQVSVYSGNVVFEQGSTKVWADKITLYTKDRQLDHILIEGTPAKFRQLDDNQQEVKADSLLMHYYTTTGLLQMRGQSHLVRPGESFNSEQIDYNARQRTVLASSAIDSNNGKSNGAGQRVKIVLQPNQPPNPSDAPAGKQ